MRLSDALSGLLFCALGLAIAFASWYMPAPAGLPVGPGVYPGVVGGTMAVFGALIAIRGLVRDGLSGFVEIDPWMRRPRAVAAVGTVLAAVVVYIVGAAVAGFLVAATALVVIAGLGFQDRPLPAVAFAVCASLVMYVFFAAVLRVPLPIGPLERVLGWIL